MHTLKNIPLLCSFTIVLIGCTNDQPVENLPELSVDKLQGRWELSSALRNNRSTETLTGTYYFFNNDSVTTNLTPEGKDQTFHFKFHNNQIKLENDADFMAFDIASLNDTLLEMRTEIRGHKFLLSFKKQIPDSSSVTPVTDSINY